MTRKSETYANANQLRVIADKLDAFVENDQFHFYLSNDAEDWRNLKVTVAYVDQPGTATFIVDRNGDVFGHSTGGLD